MERVTFETCGLTPPRCESETRGRTASPCLKGTPPSSAPCTKPTTGLRALRRAPSARTLAEPEWDVAFLNQHDWAQPMARVSNNTLDAGRG